MSSVHRAPAALKLGASLALILGLAALPAEHASWALVALPGLLLVALLARLDFKALLWRLALGVPFLLGVASLALFQPRGLSISLGLVAKAAICLLTLQLLASTTPISELVRTLRRMHVPELLCEAIALLSRYSSLLVDEARRMRRARAGRTLRSSRWLLWRALGNSIGLLFVRTVSRAERVQLAMRSRGGV
ncbi:MAG TPA: CbiQ family ECF transporter T component [Polyangiaceae bacterium]|nr:CbiQ family ECF transporter T component [Polyangiaceae bacterium]